MAMSIERLLQISGCASSCTSSRISLALADNGIFMAINFAMVDEEDIVSLFSDDVEVFEWARKSLSVAKEMVEGWSKLACAFPSNPRPMSASNSSLVATNAVGSPRPSKTPSTAAVDRAVTTLARRRAFGLKPKSFQAKKALTTKEQVEKSKILAAVAKAHSVFAKEAADSPRFRLMKNEGSLVMDMQMDVYRLGSMSYRVIATHASLAASFFLDLEVCKWRLTELTPFLVAAWVRGRVSGGSKSATRSARRTLKLVEAATGVNLFIEDPMVKGQLSLVSDHGTHDEPVKVARDFSVDITMQFEELVWKAVTPQQRCYAGFFALLAGSSLRATDALRTRSLSVSGDSIRGVSRMKSKKRWERWYADRLGFTGKEWAQSWMSELCEHSLPGDDCILYAVNTAGDAWLDRHAEYGDVRRMLHLMLVVYMHMKPEEAVTYNPHGFRHILVTIGQQLKHFNVVKESDLDQLGHWAHGSSMPRHYDSHSGVSEMSVRVALLRQVRRGWRPSPDGCLPAAPMPTSETVQVAHTGMKRVHAWAEARRTRCRSWLCGTPEDPAENAIFTNIPEGWDKCRLCG